MRKSLLRSSCIALVVATFGFGSQKSYASGVPVVDAAALTQMALDLIEQKLIYDENEKTAKESKKTTDKLTEIIEDLTGSRDMSDLLNGSGERGERRVLHTAIDSFTELAAGSGGLSGSAGDLELAAQALMAKFGLRSGADMIPAAPTSARAKSIDLAQGTAIAGMTVGESVYNGSGSRLSMIEGLIGSIDGTEDLKASVDLNTRMNGQVALLLNEMLTVQALQLRATGVNMGLAAVTEDQVVSTFGFDATQYGTINAPPSP